MANDYKMRWLGYLDQFNKVNFILLTPSSQRGVFPVQVKTIESPLSQEFYRSASKLLSQSDVIDHVRVYLATGVPTTCR